MSKWNLRKRQWAISLAGGSLLLLGGCGLSDQQWATVWSSAVSAAFNAVITKMFS
jgi:hypothetical protein